MDHTRERRALLIVNPGSRHGTRLQAEAKRAIERAGYRCDLLFTRPTGDTRQLIASAAADYAVLFTLGGDGTAMQALGAVPAEGPPVGILHGGTGNLIAHTLRVPRRIAPAVSALLAGTTARIDLGRLADGRRFAVAAGVGIDAAMVADTPRGLKRRLGVLAYVVFGARALLRFERFDVRIEIDGVTHEQQAAAVLVANFGTLLGNMITLGDGIEYDDGLLNVCVFSPGDVRDALRIARRLLVRDFRPDPCLWYAAGRSISVIPTPARPFQADGELLGSTPLLVEVEPLRGSVLVPRRPLRRMRGARSATPGVTDFNQEQRWKGASISSKARSITR
jgi:diacylglycerol kinase (ATP)